MPVFCVAGVVLDRRGFFETACRCVCLCACLSVCLSVCCVIGRGTYIEYV